uniref:Putative bacterial type II secretion system protein F domain protein n=1 Tax=uncultured marine microorganism HF4000_010L19 TaxID=455518 RepID=B3T1Q3_9ZZZZ|nr:putative bacterial type II secretion system protein F domain protein [uncultured marine microorganism HF4000_010L19]
MLSFEYKGISSGKYIEGEIDALNNAEAAHKLKEQKVIITKLIQSKKKKKEVKKKEKTSFIFGTGVKPKEILIFCKQFATMLRAGLPVLNTLNMLIEQTKAPGMKKIITSIRKDLESGNALSKCFEKHPKVFDTVVVNLIKAGEASGKLDTFLQKIVISLEKREKIKSQIKSALFYPGVLLSVAIIVTIFMLMKVVPVFAKMYEGMGVPVPGSTAAIMAASDFLRSATGGGLTLVIIILFIVSLRYLIKTQYKVRKAWHQLVLKLPIFGNLILKSILAKVALVMGNLSQAGVDLLESIDIAKSVTTNTIVIEALENIKKGVFSGETLTKLFNKEKIFPTTFSQLISVGEQTGSLDEMFGSVASYYEEEFDTAVANLASLIEPIMIVFMGITIGGLMLAMYAPIFNVGAIIG